MPRSNTPCSPSFLTAPPTFRIRFSHGDHKTVKLVQYTSNLRTFISDHDLFIRLPFHINFLYFNHIFFPILFYKKANATSNEHARHYCSNGRMKKLHRETKYRKRHRYTKKKIEKKRSAMVLCSQVFVHTHIHAEKNIILIKCKHSRQTHIIYEYKFLTTTLCQTDS